MVIPLVHKNHKKAGKNVEEEEDGTDKHVKFL